MEQELTTLNDLGWNAWFAQQANCAATEAVARVSAVDRGQMVLVDPQGTFQAKLAGSYRYNHQQASEQPCVGDWVCVEKPAGDGMAMVHAVLPRRTLLRRKSAGASVDDQLIAANVDIVIVVQSCHFDFNLKRLERYLVMVRDGGADPMILLTKTDLVSPEVLAAQLAEIESAGIRAPVITISNVTQDGIADFQQSLLPGKTYCFVGSSGIGKSTLINHLIGQQSQETQTVSDSGEGRHTTVRRELIRLESGALVIDNPGMREFGVLGAEEAISGAFADITALAEQCHYRDCTHTSEPRCAVLTALEAGTLSQAHYDSFIKLRQESDFHNLSYSEKRKKDRDFGKFIKSAKKNQDSDW